MSNETLLTAADVAQLLNIKRSTLYEAVARKQIPAIRLWSGRRKPLIRFRRADIERWLLERQSGPDGPGQ